MGLGASPFSTPYGPSSERFGDGLSPAFSLFMDSGGPLPNIRDEDLYPDPNVLYPLPGSATGLGPAPLLVPGGTANLSAPTGAADAGINPNPTLQDSSLQLGAHGLDFQLFGHGNGPSSVTITTQPGSMLLVFWGGATADLATAPTDNKGNTYRLIDQVRGYPTFPAWSQSIWVAHNIAGGSNHTVEVVCTDFEESTLVVVEAVGGKVARSVGFTSLGMGTPSTTHVGPNVTATGQALEFQAWWGESAVGQDHTASPNNGLAVIESYLIDNPDGYIQNATAWAAKLSGTHGVTWAITPAQGFAAWGLIVQGNEVVPPGAANAGTNPTPTLTGGNLEVAPPAGSASASANPTPTLTQGSVSLSPAAGSAAGGTNPTPTLTISGSASLLPTAGSASATTNPDPTFTLSALPLNAPAGSASAGALPTPTFSIGALTITAAPATAEAGTNPDPTLTVGNVNLSPASGAASASTNPTPTAVPGALTLAAPSGSADAGTMPTPTLAVGALTITASPGAAIASAPNPALVPSAISLTTPTGAANAGTNPTPVVYSGVLPVAPPAGSADAGTNPIPTLVLGNVSLPAGPGSASAGTNPTPALVVASVSVLAPAGSASAGSNPVPAFTISLGVLPGSADAGSNPDPTLILHVGQSLEPGTGTASAGTNPAPRLLVARPVGSLTIGNYLGELVIDDHTGELVIADYKGTLAL